MKKKLSIGLLVLLVVLVTGCTSKIEIPFIEGTDEATAKNLLSSNSLIPTIEYEYDDDIEEGKVIRTEPKTGTAVKKNSKVTVYISKGPSHIQAKNSTITWENVAFSQDIWEFYNPYIDSGTLYIQCHNVKLGRNIEWKDQYNDGYIFGNAAINDTFDKVVPVKAKYEKKIYAANEPQAFTLEIPLGDLGVSKPTNMHIKLFALSDGVEGQVNISFSMTW